MDSIAGGLDVTRYTGFDRPQHLTVDPAGGGLWVAETSNDTIVHIQTSAPDGYSITDDTGSHKRAVGFNVPQGPATDSSGRCWIADFNRQRVIALDPGFPDGYDVDSDTGSHIESANLGGVEKTAIHPFTNECWTIDNGRNQTARIDTAGNVVSREGGLNTPIDIDINSHDGTVWVLDSYQQRVHAYGTSGQETSSFLTHDSPWAMAVDPGVYGLDTPSVSASVDPTSGDVPLDTTFTGSATDNGTVTLYEWDFDGDGTYDWNDADSGDTTHQYDTPGNLVPTLKVTDDDGLTGFGIPGAVALGPITVTATATPSSATTNSDVYLDCDVSGPVHEIELYEWDIDGNGSYDRSSSWDSGLTARYNDSGVYQARVRVTASETAVTDTVTVTIISAPPVAAAGATPAEGPSPLSVTFSGSNDAKGQSLDPDGSIVLYQWDLDGDGAFDWSSDTGADAGYTYMTEGIRFATLRVVDNDGLYTTDSVRINVTQKPPVAIFTTDVTEGNEPLTVNFDASESSDPDGSIAAYEWDFGDTATGTGQMTSHEFVAAGTYTITLTVTDDDGAVDSAQTVVTVKPAGSPNAVAAADPTQGLPPLDVTYTGTGTDDGSISLYEWDFDGDGTYDWSSDTDGATTHSFESKGLYPSTLRVTDDAALTDTDIVDVLVGSPPEARPSGTPLTGEAPLDVLLRTGGYDADGTIETYEWDFDGDGTFDETYERTQNVVHTYVGQGDHTARLRVVDNDGFVDTADIVIAVTSDDTPVAEAAATPTAGSHPLDVQMLGRGTDMDGTLTLFEWDFDGDGTFDWSSTTTGETVHTYTEPGHYDAVFRVTDNNANTATDSVLIRARETGSPSALALATPSSGAVALSVEFSGIVTDPGGNITLYEWDFDGDGTYDWSSADSPDVTHNYTTVGVYDARLRVTDNDALTDVDVVSITADLGIYTTQDSDAIGPTLGHETNITSVLTGSAIITLRIVDSAGADVRTLVDGETREAGTYSDVWDGRDTGGSIVSPGIYYYLMDYEVDGRTYTYDLTMTARTDSEPVWPNFSYPTTFAPYENRPMTMEFTLDVKSEVTTYIAWSDGSAPQYRIRTIYERNPMPSGPTVIVWDGTNDDGIPVDAGSYTLCVLSWDLSENSIIVMGKPVLSDLTVDPNLFSPAFNPYISGSNSELSTSFRLNKQSTVALRFENDANDTVKLITVNDVPAGSSTVTWNGRDETGSLVGPGLYRVGVEAEDAFGNTSLLRYAMFIVYY